MQSISVTQARKNLYSLIDEVYDSHNPIQITGKRSNAVILSEDDWNAVQETLFLNGIPGVKDSIVKGMNTKLSDCSDDIKW